MSHLGMSHVTLMHESRHTTGDTYLEILQAVKEEQPDMRMRHVTLRNESCHVQE